MSNQQNIATVKAFFDEVYTKGHLVAADKYLAPDLRFHDASAPDFHGGLEGWKERESMYRKAFPNKLVQIDDIFSADDNRVIVQWTVQGTQKGELHDIPATHKHIKVTGIVIYRLAHGKIADITQSWDRLGLLEQLGIVEHALAHHYASAHHRH